MNLALREEIVKHVFANLGMHYGSYVDTKKTRSLISKDFLLKEKLSFRDSQEQTIQNKVWGCQVSVDKSDLKILVGDCSQSKDLPEYCLIIQLTGSPAYGLYLICSDKVDSEAMIAVNVNNNGWMECGTYLQATFLAGMEQIRDVGMNWNKCTNYQEQFEIMENFLKFQSTMQGVDDEGQED